MVEKNNFIKDMMDHMIKMIHKAAPDGPEEAERLIYEKVWWDKRKAAEDLRNVRREKKNLQKRLNRMRPVTREAEEGENEDGEASSTMLGSAFIVETKQLLKFCRRLPCSCGSLSPRTDEESVRTQYMAITYEWKCGACKKAKTFCSWEGPKDCRIGKLIYSGALLSSINAIGVTNCFSETSYYRFLPRTLISFDCSWSHPRNANEASGELIAHRLIEGYSSRPVIAQAECIKFRKDDTGGTRPRDVNRFCVTKKPDSE